jgi:thiamine-phosphate pyrophosphorylase
MLSKLQYISQGSTGKEQLHNIQKALNGGCKWIQLRWKNVSKDQFIPVASEIKHWCKQHQATFIINDYVEWAKEIGADGIHLGLDDTHIEQARQILGPDKIIGGTANTYEDVVQRIEEGCDYIGLGPFRFTKTKEKLSPVLGLEGYKVIIDKLNSEGKQAKIYAIGGIELEDLQPLMDTGIYGIAVSGLMTKTDIKTEDILEKVRAKNFSPQQPPTKN